MITDMVTWESLPDLKDGHPSQEGRNVPTGTTTSGDIEYEWYPVPCGEWWNGGVALCEGHERMYSEQYPQGWRSYPGDICPHGKYVGGVGVDWICGPCEMGDDDA